MQFTQDAFPITWVLSHSNERSPVNNFKCYITNITVFETKVTCC